MENKKSRLTLYDIVAVGLMAAVVFVVTMFLSIRIPTPTGTTMIKLANAFVLLCGLLLGPVRGGLAAGFGSMLFDLMTPEYAPEAWLTFLRFFLMAWLCGQKVVAQPDRLHHGGGRLLAVLYVQGHCGADDRRQRVRAGVYRQHPQAADLAAEHHHRGGRGDGAVPGAPQGAGQHELFAAYLAPCRPVNRPLPHKNSRRNPNGSGGFALPCSHLMVEGDDRIIPIVDLL